MHGTQSMYDRAAIDHQRAIRIKFHDHSSVAEKNGRYREVIFAVGDMSYGGCCREE